MSAAYSQEKQVAISAVLKASLVARKVQDQLIGSGGVQKKDKSPVTGTFLPLYLVRREGKITRRRLFGRKRFTLSSWSVGRGQEQIRMQES